MFSALLRNGDTWHLHTLGKRGMFRKIKDIAEEVKDAAVESTAKISEGAAVGIDKGKKYADAIAIAALAVSETVRTSVLHGGELLDQAVIVP